MQNPGLKEKDMKVYGYYLGRGRAPEGEGNGRSEDDQSTLKACLKMFLK
jgi:hypothetical protein